MNMKSERTLSNEEVVDVYDTNIKFLTAFKSIEQEKRFNSLIERSSIQVLDLIKTNPNIKDTEIYAFAFENGIKYTIEKALLFIKNQSDKNEFLCIVKNSKV